MQLSHGFKCAILGFVPPKHHSLISYGWAGTQALGPLFGVLIAVRGIRTDQPGNKTRVPKWDAGITSGDLT